MTFKLGHLRARGRKPAADIVLAPAAPTPPKSAYVVVEAKKPGESLDEAAGQAWSYTLALRAPLFVTTNGVDFQLWRVRLGQEHDCILAERVDKLGSVRGRLVDALGRNGVLAFVREASSPGGRTPVFNSVEYLRRLEARVPAGLTRRMLRDEAQDEAQVVWPDALDGAHRIQLTGGVGRGKTACLWLAADHWLRPQPGRIPVFPRIGAGGAQCVKDAIFAELREYLAPEVRAEDFPDWLKEQRVLVCLDDWHRLSADAQSHVESELSSLSLDSCTVVVAGRPGASGPALAGFRRLVVPTLSDQESNELIESRLRDLGSTFCHANAFWPLVPRSLKSLLREPVHLSRALQLLELSPRGVTTLPQSLSALLDELFAVAVGTVRQGLARIDEAMRACELVSEGDVPFDLTILAGALARVGAPGPPAEFAEALVESNILARLRPGEYEFGHEAWRAYFQARAQSRRHPTSEGLVGWIASEVADERCLRAQLVASLITEPNQQDRFLGELLELDLTGYLQALVARAPIDVSQLCGPREQWELERVANGRQELVAKYFKGLMHRLVPWAWGDPDSLTVGVSGHVTDQWLDYGYMLPESGRSEKHGVNLALTGIRRDSGRLVAAVDVLKAVVELSKPSKLPWVGWVARERLRNFAVNLNPGEWGKMTVVDMAQVFRRLGPGDAVLLSDGSRLSVREGIERRWLLGDALRTCERLMDCGSGDVTMVNLVLPGPDLPLTGGPFWRFYSRGRRLERAAAYFHALMETYREVCEADYAGVSSYLLFGQGPIRANVCHITRDDMSEPTWAYWWEPRNNWGDLPAVVEGEPEIDQLETAAAAYAAKGRSSECVSVTEERGSWCPTGDCVAEGVSRLLVRDLEQVASIVAGGT